MLLAQGLRDPLTDRGACWPIFLERRRRRMVPRGDSEGETREVSTEAKSNESC